MKAILDELTKLEQEYARNVRDNPEKLEFTPEEMKGLPQSYISALKKNAKGNYLLGFEYPEYRPLWSWQIMMMLEKDIKLPLLEGVLNKI